MFNKKLTYSGSNGDMGDNGTNGSSGESGTSGTQGDSGQRGKKNGTSGKNGKKGGNGTNAKSHGARGTNGSNGDNGLDITSIIKIKDNKVFYSNTKNDNFEVKNTDRLLVDTSGGVGGAGGDGGRGGNGGDGGDGGAGGVGGDARSQVFSGKKRKNNGGNGGNGGDGGDGGSGGNAKNGGDGGNGGNGGNGGVNKLIAHDPRLFTLVTLMAKAGAAGRAGASGGGGTSDSGRGGKGGSGGDFTFGIHGGRHGDNGDSGQDGDDGNFQDGHSGEKGRSGEDGKNGTAEYTLETNQQNKTFSSPYDIALNVSTLEAGTLSDGVLAPGEKIKLSVLIENNGGMPFPKDASLIIVSKKLDPSKFEINLPEIKADGSYKNELDAKILSTSNHGDSLIIESTVEFPLICKKYRNNVLDQTITVPITVSQTKGFPKDLYPNKEASVHLKVNNNSKVPYKGIKISSTIKTGSITFKDSSEEYSIDIDSIAGGSAQDVQIPLITNKLINEQHIEINTSVFALDSSVFETNTVSTVTSKKKLKTLLMALLGYFINLPLQRMYTYHAWLSLGIAILLYGAIVMMGMAIGSDTEAAALAQGVPIAEVEGEVPPSPFSVTCIVIFLILLLLFWGFQVFDIVNILRNKYKDGYGNLLAK